MLASIDHQDQIQIARQVYRMAKARQRHRGTYLHRNSVGVEHPQNNPKHDDLKLPAIPHRADNSLEKPSPQYKQSGRKKAMDGSKLMEIIKREISLQKRTYFQTISSDKALIIKNSARQKDEKGKEGKEGKEGRQKTRPRRIQISNTEGQLQEVMTPPYKVFKSSGKVKVDLNLPKSVKKTIQINNWQEQYTPWNNSHSQQIIF